MKAISSHSTVWIGDTEIDVDAAKYLGVTVCAVTCGLRTAEYLETLNPDYLEADLSSLAAKFH